MRPTFNTYVLGKSAMSAPLIFAIFSVLVMSGVNSRHVNNECRNTKFENCFCGNAFYLGREYFVVNCTDQRFTDVELLRNLPDETEALIFTGNDIPTLPWKVFGDMNSLSKLKVIDMSNNNIKEIKGKAYQHVHSVETLILNHNDLVVSEDEYPDNMLHPRVFSSFINLRELHLTNAFADNTDSSLAEDLHDIFYNSNLQNLMKIHLEQNEIKYFKDPNLFCALPGLKQLYLGQNYLPNVNFNVRCLKLQFLDLERNNITRLSEDDLDAFDLLNKAENLTVDLRNNPLKCELAGNLHDWLLTTKVQVRFKDQLQCQNVRYGKKNFVKLVELEKAKHAKTSKAITVLLVVLILILISLVSAYVYLHRDKLRTRVAPLLDVVSRKVQYTTIDSQIV